MDAQQKERITGYFIEEAKEHLVTIGDGLQDFGKTVNDPEAIQELYRAAHSIKGGAAMLGFGSLQKNALRLEDYFKHIKSSPVAVDETLTGLFVQLFAPLQRLVAELEANLTLPPERESEILTEINPIAEKLQRHLQQLSNGGSPQNNHSQVTPSTNGEPEQPLASSQSRVKQGQASTQNTRNNHHKDKDPIMGMEALNTLADLFENDDRDLEQTWQEDGTMSNVGQQQSTDNDDWLGELGEDTDFSDLLAETEDLSASNSSPEDFSSLFGELEELSSNDSSNGTLESPESSLDSENDDLSELFGEDFSFEPQTTDPKPAQAESNPKAGKFDHFAEDLNALFSGDDFSTGDFFDQWQESQTQGKSPINPPPSSTPAPRSSPTPDSSSEFDDLLAISEAAEEDSEPGLTVETPQDKDAESEWSLEALMEDQGESQPPQAKTTGKTAETVEPTLDAFEDLFAGEPPASEDDFESLFGDDPAELNGNGKGASAQPKASEQPEASEDDFLDLLNDASEDNSNQGLPEIAETEDNFIPTNIEALENLFATESPEAPGDNDPFAEWNVEPEPPKAAPKTNPVAPAKAQTSTSPAVTVDYFEQVDELAALLEQPPTIFEGELNPKEIETLETFINTSPQAVEEDASPLKTVEESRSTDISSLDDEFGDLEDLLQQANQSIGPANAKTTSPPTRVRSAKGFDHTMRVPVKQLDNLSNLVGELVVNRNSLEQDQERLRQFLDNLLHQVQNLSDVGARMQDLYERSLLESSLLASRKNYRSAIATAKSTIPGPIHNQDYDPLEMDRFTGFHLLSQEMIELIVRVREASSDIEFLVDETDQLARNLRQVTTQLQEGLTKTRMMPFAQTADRLPRAVRNIAIEYNKKADLIVEGKDTLIDKMILEHLYDPMTHLVNNAMTHGIELPEERRAKGKAETGKIHIRAFHQGNQTVISVGDDGAGIDPDKVKRKAIEKGLITRGEAAGMTNVEVYDLLFHPGFSTKDKADNFAGRGVGMDVVRTSLSEIRGTVSVDSKLGKGTTFTIRLPLTLSICKALCCISNKARIAFPMDGIEDMIDIPPQSIQTNAEGEPCVMWRNALLPFQPLSDLLSYNRQIGRGVVYGGVREDDMVSLVILRSVNNVIAIQVDQVIGEQEIVIKQLEGPIPKPTGIAGATVLGDGRIMPIGDVLELIDLAQGRIRKDSGSTLWQQAPIPSKPQSDSLKTEPMVLIVDDSITVRELLSMSFNKAGYRVEQARDGLEAWDKLRSGLPCDLIFCDIEMPRMDGLELLSRLQQEEELRHIPMAMLTSRGAQRHRQMASDMGAKAYFTKPYLEEALLDAAQRMLQGHDLLNQTRRPEPTVKTPPSVLIIDDSVTVRELLSMTFQKAGYQVEQARDGQDAWEKLNSEKHFDIVFCDIEMPRMDGLELLSHLHQDEKLNKVPVAMLTSRGAQKHRKIAADRGAKGYFTKPYVEDVLIDAAKRMRNGEVLLESEA